MQVTGHNMHAAGWKLQVKVAICGLPVITCMPRLEIVGKSPVDSLASLSSIRRQVNFSKEAKLRYGEGVLGVCQSIDDGGETALTGGLQDLVDFQVGYEIFEKYL